MTQHGGWAPYAGGDALVLAVVLFGIGVAFAYFGMRLHRPVGPARPGWAVGVLLVLMWVLAFLTFGVAVTTYARALVQQVGPFTPPANPISPITGASGLVAFVVIALVSRRYGMKTALGSAIVGTIAAPMIFELPFDLIVMWRTYPPSPGTQFTLLFFLPLFLWEVASFALLTLSPAMRVSRYAVWSLAGMFFVFAVWALAGFSYPSEPLPFACNTAAKILSFAAAVTLFVPESAAPAPERMLRPAVAHGTREPTETIARLTPFFGEDDAAMRASLRGTVRAYRDPTAPVAGAGWEARTG